MYEVKKASPDASYIKKWKDEPVKSSVSSSYTGKKPTKWDVDDFKHWVDDNMDAKGKIANKEVAKVTGIPQNVDVVDYLNDGGSGLNNNKQFDKYENWGAALYDIFIHIKNKYF